MRDLEHDLELLEDLDVQRIRSARLRDMGYDALTHWKATKTPDLWTIRAFAARDGKAPQPEVRRLEARLTSDLAPEWAVRDNGPLGSLPILNAAVALRVLISVPGYAFSETVPRLLYLLVRELYVADEPDWVVGGARAAETGSVTAHTTSACVGALIEFINLLQDVARFAQAVGRTLRRIHLIEDRLVPTPWRDAEAARLSMSFRTMVLTKSRRMAIRLRTLPSSHEDIKSVNDLHRVLSRIEREMLTELRRIAAMLDKARTWASAFRAKEDEQREQTAGGPLRFRRSAAAHEIALEAVNRSATRAAETHRAFTNKEQSAFERWNGLGKHFEEAATDALLLLRPTRRFLATVLDRELAAAAAEHSWDASELASAAVAYGHVSSDWSDERLERAGRQLAGALTERGRFPAGKPFHASSDGVFYPTAFSVTATCADLLRYVQDVPIDARLAKRLLALFEDTCVPRLARESVAGWRSEDAGESLQPQRWLTAQATLALAHVNQMLDERINALVYRHFSVKGVRELRGGPRLSTAFYSDYGFHAAPPSLRRASLAVVLEEMKAHVNGVGGGDKSHSLVLHGPPGTGKTTFVEALAASCEVPLVEVTPSDIVVGGEDAIERRARAVFRALRLLTRTVILFDEFDPVLRARKPDVEEPHTVFSFLTPGMLPKLKELYRDARRRRVAYVLVTNIIGGLDTAAVRAGRFDKHIGVYPPDPLSRLGRLATELLAWRPRLNRARVGPRLIHIVAPARGAAMERLARSGWFTCPREGERLTGTPFGYLTSRPRRDRAPAFGDPDAVYSDKPKWGGADAEREWREWTWIREWDEIVSQTRSTGAASVAPKSIELAIRAPGDSGLKPQPASQLAADVSAVARARGGRRDRPAGRR